MYQWIYLIWLFHLYVSSSDVNTQECLENRLQSFRLPTDILTEHVSIYRPIDRFLESLDIPKEEIDLNWLPGQLFASPEAWVARYNKVFAYLDTVSLSPFLANRAIFAYSSFMINYLIGLSFDYMERTVPAQMGTQLFTKEVNITERELGRDWPYLGRSMVGKYRLEHLHLSIHTVVEEGIPGSFVETGIWRGGSCMLARALFRVYNETHREVLACDSFRGLPPGDEELYGKLDVGWQTLSYLAVEEEIVRDFFVEMGVLDEQVYFVKGFFNDSMPVVAKHIDAISILRLDGDLYESTVDVLYHLYHRVSLGGYIVVDDWGLPAENATFDFLQIHDPNAQIEIIDNNSRFWRKQKHVDIEYWRYEEKVFTP